MNQEQRPSIEKISVKKLTIEDASKYKEIRLKGLQTDARSFGATYEEESKKDDEYWKRKMSRPERSFYGVEEGDRLIATAGLMELSQEDFMITAVYTLPEFRKKNISTELLQTIISEVKTKGAQKIALNVNADNPDALKLYEKLGFKIITTTKDVVKGDGTVHDSYRMEKVL